MQRTNDALPFRILDGPPLESDPYLHVEPACGNLLAARYPQGLGSDPVPRSTHVGPQLTPAKLDRLAGQVLDLEELEAELKGAIDVIKKSSGLLELEERKKAASADAERLRSELSDWYGEQHSAWLERCRAGQETPLPALPTRLSFQARTSTVVVSAADVPREACAPVAKLLKPGMAGTEQVCTHFARIAQPKGKSGN